MSLLAKLQANTATKPSVQSEMRRLELEEINTKYPGVADSFDQLEAVGLGMPELAGEAARVYAIVKGLEGGATFAGSGELGGFTFTEIPEIMQVLVEARGIIEARGTSLMPAADPVNPFPDDAPPPLASPPEKKEEPVVTVEDALAVAAGEKKTKETKEKKTKAKKADPVVEVPEVEAIDQPTVVAESKAINLFVDCIPSTDYESFWPIVNEVTKTMAREFGGVDYRACDDKSPAGFGKWKGWLANGLRIIKIPGGNYLLDNAMTETGGVIVEAMREIVAESGGMLVRGI